MRLDPDLALSMFAMMISVAACSPARNLQTAAIQADLDPAVSERSAVPAGISQQAGFLAEEFLINEQDVSSGLNNIQGEVSMAVNRNNPDQAAAAIMNVLPGTNSGNLLLAITSDGGETWVNRTLMTDTNATNIADPMLAWDGEGRLFLAQLPVLSGNIPLGVDVLRSLDGGLSWETPVRISSARGQDDKVALAADDNPDSPYFGNVYVAWKWPPGPTWFSRSTDHGGTFSPPQNIDIKGISGLDLTVASDGAVLLASNFGGGGTQVRGPYVQRSLDGGVSFGPSTRAARGNARFEVFPAAHCTNPGAFINASIDADRTGGLHDGQVLLSWVDYPDSAPVCPNPCSDDCPTVVRYAVSDDTGQTWSEGKSLPSPGGAQFFQWSDIDQANGDWYISYRDTSDDPLHRSAMTRLVRSDDQGQTWSDPLTLSSDTGVLINFPGHYYGLAAQNGKIYAGWADYRSNQRGDFYIASVDRRETFQINSGLNDAWVNAEGALQGMFITVFPELKIIFLAWFTFDSTVPPDDAMAIFGAPDQRWVTALGSYEGKRAELNAELTSGGLFNSSEPLPVQDTQYGNIILEFSDCAEATVSFDFPSAGELGEFTINRVLEDNIALCLALQNQR